MPFSHQLALLQPRGIPTVRQSLTRRTGIVYNRLIHCPFLKARQVSFESLSSALPCWLRPLPRQTSYLRHWSRNSAASPSSSLPATSSAMPTTTSPYGSWKSPLSSEFVTGSTLSIGGAGEDPAGRLIWIEGRPSEGGRNVLVREGATPGSPSVDLVPSDFNVRTAVHEYGGGACCVAGDVILACRFSDQRVYKISIAHDAPSAPEPITPSCEGRALRYADGRVDSTRNLFFCVREDHRISRQECRNEIVAVQVNGDAESDPTVVCTGTDFYSSPRPSPDGRHLAWIEWKHPSMPWDKTQLWVGALGPAGEVVSKVCVAGDASGQVEAPQQPVWASPGGNSGLVLGTTGGRGSDRAAAGEVWQRVGGEGAEKVLAMPAEFGTPPWVFGSSTFSFLPKSAAHLVCTYKEGGVRKLALLDTDSKQLSPIATPYTEVSSVFAGKEALYLVGGSPKLPTSIVQIDLKSKTADRVVKASMDLDFAHLSPYLSEPEIVKFPTAKGGGQNAFAAFYRPQNKDFDAPPGTLPPLLVKIHGYGREYRERLYETWGVVDVDDCCSCAQYLVSQGKVDGKQLAIDGGSAGGFTTLAVLAFRDTFGAGCSLYGVSGGSGGEQVGASVLTPLRSEGQVSDLMALATDTHKFESRYLDQLVGPVDTSAAVYRERSPLYHIEKFNCPIVLFQGLEDRVVPPNQAKEMYEAVKAKGIPTALVEYPGEDHGFRIAANIRSTLEWEMLFFSRVFATFKLADEVPPLHIDNLNK